MTRIAIIGVGPGDERYLTVEARTRIAAADLAVTTDRLFGAFSHLNPSMLCAKLSDIPDTVRDAGRDASVAVLVSGDSGFYSLGKTLPDLLRERLGDSCCDVTFFSGISSLQYLCAKLGVSHDDVKAISLHGKQGDIVPFVSYNRNVFALTGGAVKAHDVIRRLADAGLGHVTVAVGADMASASERILRGTPEDLAGEIFPDLTSLLVCHDDCRNPHQRLTDADFIRGKAPMTKDAVRTLAIAALDIQPIDTVFDIGAGTGSVAVCLARKAFAGTVYAVERNADALDLLARNRLALGAYNVAIVKAEAPDGAEALPVPDKVFIGGSGGKLGAIMRHLFAGNARVRVAITAVTLESLHAAVAAFETQGIEPEVSCVNVAVAHKTGTYRMMKAENPVYIICGGGHAR